MQHGGAHLSRYGRRIRPARSEAEQGWAEREDRARVDPVLLFEFPLQAVVEEREQELLAARAEAAGGAVQRRQRDVLDLAGDAAHVREVAVLAGIADLHG